jgi:hypothetical protein
MEEEQQKSNGGKHLLILCIFTILSSLAMVAVSLYVYHDSGDIYLDRSRPGFLPEEAEKNRSTDEDFSFPDTGNIKQKNLEEYIENLDKVIESLDKMSESFSDDVLTNESLGI